jgi:hypothetical protein
VVASEYRGVAAVSPRSTGILLVIAAALGAFVYFYEIGGEQERLEAEEQAKRLFPDVEEGTIDAIAFDTTDGVAVRLERGEMGWSLTAPLTFPADSFAADGLASNLVDLVSEAELEEPQPPEEYGLGEGTRIVRFQAGSEERALRIGRSTPIGANSYALVEGRDEIFTVPTFRLQSFEKALDDLRERRILDFDRDGIVRIEASWPGGSVTLERSAGAPEAEEGEAAGASPLYRWRVVSPLATRADDETVDQLLSLLSFLRADGFVDDPPDDEAAGLSPPAFEIVLTSAASPEGEVSTTRLAIGGVHEGDARLLRAAQPSLYTISADRLDDFPRDSVAYRYRTLSKFSSADAQQVDFFFQPASGDPVAVMTERGADGWGSSSEHVAPGKVATLVAELSDLKASGIVAESVGDSELEGLGLSPPNAIITVFGAAPEDEDAAEEEGEGGDVPADPTARPRLAEIQIGRVEDSEWIIARAVGDPVIYRLDYDLAEHLPVSLDAFRNRFVREPEKAEEAGEAPLEENGDFLTPSQESP